MDEIRSSRENEMLEDELRRMRDEKAAGYFDSESSYVSSDDELPDPNNYKGIFYGQEEEKYIDPTTGAHFRHEEICGLMQAVIQERNSVQERLKEQLIFQKDRGRESDLYKTSDNFKRMRNRGLNKSEESK